MKQVLSPTLEDLRAEFVLMQAWKKTSSYLRQHSWYSDTLEVDFQSLRIPEFLREVRARLDSPELWIPSPLDFVPAPKGQSWRLQGDRWLPHEKNIRKKIRPLAHVALQDQVVGTALLLCLADAVERSLGDPLISIDRAEDRRKVLAYGHRLFCDSSDGVLQHRWGSAKLYRLYYRDYRTFLRRPEVTVEQLKAAKEGREIAIVHSDLSKFYDRVRPAMLHEKVARLLPEQGNVQFLDLFRRVFDWPWHDRDRARQYADLHDIPGFEAVALPQGLVASGFFANIALMDLDAALRNSLDAAIDGEGRLILKDVCYYVDDLRLVLLVNQKLDEKEIEDNVQSWLQRLLDQHAPGLIVETSKTKATVVGRQKRYFVPQSRTATRIQRDVSGVLDMLHGSELIGAIEGFFHTQKRYSSDTNQQLDRESGLLIGISDMRDDTAARFAAGRFRRTFRSLRPLLDDAVQGDGADESADEGETLPARLVLSRKQLDERGRFFAAMLIDEWVANPGNVRLLRIAFDLYPDAEFLDRVLKLLRPGWDVGGGSRLAQREVQQYCLAELFRAAATETGIIGDDDCLPSGVEVANYQKRLTEEAQQLLRARIASPAAPKRFPWYLLQQVLLYLAAQNQLTEVIASGTRGLGRGLNRYRRFAHFLDGTVPLGLTERAIYLILATSSFGLPEVLERISDERVSPQFLRRLTEISPETAMRMWDQLAAWSTDGQSRVARVMGLSVERRSTGALLPNFVLRERNPFWQEVNLLRLAHELLALPESAWPETLTPWQIECDVSAPNGSSFGELMPGTVRITSAVAKAGELFSVPGWCETAEERRRFQLGMILRFSLRGSVDFLSIKRPKRLSHRPRYSTPVSHWERQKYSTFQGRISFGPSWIPLSSWAEDFLFDLLRWPGAGVATPSTPLTIWTQRVSQRLVHLGNAQGEATGLPVLEQLATWPGREPKEWTRPLRVGIAQTVVPDMDDYRDRSKDPELLGDRAFRIRQRRHLASMLEAVIQMLAVRETHRPQPRNDGQLIDLLVLPELAVHPLDIQPLLLPFVRTHKCMVLFGLVYHPIDDVSGSPLINSCLWAIPEWRPATGFQVRMVEQGKEHLTIAEKGLTPRPASFRPAQWIIEYRWISDRSVPPLRLSASVCYDSTDLALASDLKTRNDLYFVCALNQDVGTFDRMAEGLHYHMYQGVIVVNNGQFGGSSFYLPFGEQFERQVFHLHGQPQASIAFAEISPQKLINRPNQLPTEQPVGKWKTQPANWNSPVTPNPP